VDESGLVIGYEEYHPYGTTAYASGRGGVEVSGKRYRYTGKERDEETGLYYHGARHMAPWLGRWTSADPAGMVDGNNLYQYSRGNPVMFIDGTGNDSTLVGGAKALHDATAALRGPEPAPAPATKVPAIPLMTAIDRALGTVGGKPPPPPAPPLSSLLREYATPIPTSPVPTPEPKAGPELTVSSEEAQEWFRGQRALRGMGLDYVIHSDAEIKERSHGQSWMEMHPDFAFVRNERLTKQFAIIATEALVFEGFSAWSLAADVAGGGITIASSAEGTSESLLSEASLSARQTAIHRALPDPGATGSFAKKAVSMADLRSISRVTGDEYSMFTLGARRFVIRGYGNEIVASDALASDLNAGLYGRWSGHTHPPGSSLDASTFDRHWLPREQERSAIWGEGDEGYRIFHRTPADDSVFELGRRREEMQRLYGGH
jgi:RHS repeat-associated protein